MAPEWNVAIGLEFDATVRQRVNALCFLIFNFYFAKRMTRACALFCEIVCGDVCVRTCLLLATNAKSCDMCVRSRVHVITLSLFIELLAAG